MGAVPAAAQPTPMPLDMIGVGPHGYDFMIGRWDCTEAAAMLGKRPVAWAMKVQMVGDGSLLQVMSSNGFGIWVQPLRYISETKTWSISEANEGGNIIYSQTTQDTGQKTLWIGWELSGSQDIPPHKIYARDTWTFPSLDEFLDATERQTGARGTWEAWQNSTCKRS